MKKIKFFDTSLRDGAQTPWVNLISEDKIKIAKKLDNLWLDYIEAWFAASSESDFKAISTIVSNTENAVIYSLARMVENDIVQAYNALSNNLSKAGIHVFIWTSPLHRKKLNKEKKEILDIIEKHMNIVTKLFQDNENIMFSPEDAFRTEEDFLMQVIEVAVKNGAKQINIPDTVWWAQPEEIYDTISKIKNKFPDVQISIHCHNDLGMAVINSLYAIKAWAEIIQGTIPPLFGERAGNADLVQVLMNLKKRADYYWLNIEHIAFEEIYPTVNFIEKISGKRIPEHYPILGRLTYTHSAWIHQDWVAKNSKTYEIISPEEIGMEIEKLFILTNQSWRAGLKFMVNHYFGLDIDDEALNKIFIDFKKLTSQKKYINMKDIW
jgi:2-isopropylmalate synthase